MPRDLIKAADANRARFLSKFSEGSPDDCWEWRGTLFSSGYGQFRLTDSPVGAHRMSYAFYKRHNPGTMHVCHTCDNPVCVNPFHLVAGTPKDNAGDRTARGRGLYRVGESSPHHRLTDSQADEIRVSSENQYSTAKRYGVNQSTVSRIRSGGRRGKGTGFIADGMVYSA